MIDSKLIEYIKASTSSGLTKDQIVQQLRNVGWNEKDKIGRAHV